MLVLKEDIIVELKRLIIKSEKPYDLEVIDRAIDLACRAHEGQKRRSGEDYVCHPLQVACILVELGMDSETIAAAILHDVVEDTPVELQELKRQFGGEIAELVDGVTKLNKIPFSTREEQQAENVRKMLLSMAQDVRVIIIKLADRLHNMRTIQYCSEAKRRRTALETMEVYAPLAHRLGIRAVKEELEDISIKYLDPVAYSEINNKLALEKEDRQKFLEHIKEKIQVRLQEEHKQVYLEGRVKSIYGIYRKVYMQGKAFEEIYDIYAVRIIVDTVTECYNCLGIMHDMFRPIPNRFKDYISTPKANMYQSLHTTVLDREGIPFEIQIRTWEMHYTAEYGIAAHWKYKVGLAGAGKDRLDDRLAWVRQLLEAQKESEDVEDIVRSIKTDLSPDEVFVFTPKGDVIRLPSDSTVIDFAYAIHTAVGNKMVGAKVDGRMVSLDFVVKTGMIVEIITTKDQNHGPSRDWLNIVRTSEARNKIRNWFKKERREENIAQGKLELEKEFKRNLINLPEEDAQAFIEDIARRQRYENADEFYAAIGYGGVSLSKIIPRIKDDFLKLYRGDDPAKSIAKPKKERKAAGGVIVEGLEGCLVKFAKCCNPIPGDEIVGFVTRGFGVSIHKADCPNVDASRKDPQQEERWVSAHWSTEVRQSYKSTIEIQAQDRGDLLADISIAISNMKVPLHALNARENREGDAVIQITLGISSVEQLNAIIGTFRKIRGVDSVERIVQ